MSNTLDASASPLRALQRKLLASLRATRQRRGITQQDVATTLGLSRVTVSRAEAADADPQLSTFLGMALVCGLEPNLHVSGESAPAPAKLQHRGLSYIRTQHDLDWRDRQRERALAKAWETANRPSPVGLQPIMPTLVPGCTQEQATACATVVQWLGSEVGFEFLQQALRNAGYDVVDKKAGPTRR